MLTGKEQNLLQALEAASADQSIEIVTVELTGAKKAPTIRVYIDTPSGVSFDELSAAQVWINEAMDRLDPFPGAYTLEVSSPGIDRPLRTPEHFRRFAGETVLIYAEAQADGRKKWTGKLAGIEGTQVRLITDTGAVSIEYDDIKRAQIKGVIDFNAKSSEERNECGRF